MKLLVPHLLLSSLVVTLVAAQGRTDYMNVESPQVHPLEVFAVAGHDFLAACNTRNNTLEIYDTNESLAERRVAVVRVGLEPVSVRFHTGLSKLYTANFLGDSISIVDVGAPAGAGTLSPRSIARPGSARRTARRRLLPGHGRRDHARDAVRDPHGARRLRLARRDHPAGARRRQMAPRPSRSGSTRAIRPTARRTSSSPSRRGEPRSVRVRNGKLFILAQKGGTNSLASLDFDLDYYCNDLRTGSPTRSTSGTPARPASP
jgi:hypothetical protein